MLSFNIGEISSIMNDISLITKVKFDLYDKDFNILHGDEGTMCRLCRLVRTVPELHKKCIESDRAGFSCSERKREAYTYKCHMGLTETVTPIIFDGSIVGYIMIGQKLMREDYCAVEANINSLFEGEIKSSMLEALDKMKYTTVEELGAMCNLVKICSSYLQMKKLVKYRDASLAERLEQYISENIAEELDVKRLCKEFVMSKSSLYLLSRNAFGKGITEYVEDVRIERAKELLLSSDEPVSIVAERVGYADSNYFTKVFKKQVGVPPSTWRKSQTV